MFMDEKKTAKDLWWKPAVVVFANTTAWIAIPIVIALILGKFLDKKYETGHTFFFVLIALAFLVTVGGIVRMLRKNIWKQNK